MSQPEPNPPAGSAQASARGPALVRSRWKRSLARVLGAAACVYIALLAVGCMIQDSLVFPGTSLRASATQPPDGAEQVWIEIENGARVEGWFFPGQGRTSDNPGPALLFFHGNGELIEDNVRYGQLYARWGISTLIPEYRGYGRSGGKPSQRGIGHDMDRFHAWLVARPEVKPHALIYHGYSLGGGIATDLARRHPPAAMILVATFTSMRAMFAGHGAPGFLAAHPFDVKSVVETFPGPILLIHGTRDEVIPIRHGQALAKAAQRGTFIEMDETHILPKDWDAFAGILREFLSREGFAAE